jgi:prepilin-type processing-associated H-X9-DG protein/prepilin-type N-terminal cleavage/methylation domain-containing protein
MKTEKLRKRFTLVELLVVIAVVAILASLLFPALKNARAKAKEIACLSNLKQFNLANAGYVSDEDGWLPYGVADYKLWDYLLMPYLNYPQDSAEASSRNDFSVYHCPGGAPSNISSNYRSRGYSYNNNLTRTACKLSSIDMQGKKLLIADSAGSTDDLETWTFCKTFRAVFVDRFGYLSNLIYRHSEKVNVLFVDGHAGACPKSIYDSSWEEWVPEGVEW